MKQSQFNANFFKARASSSHGAVIESLHTSRSTRNPIRCFGKDSGNLNGPRGTFGSTGYDLQPCSPTASEAEKRSMERVAGLKGSRAAGAVNSAAIKRYRATVTDKHTGLPTEVTVRIITTTVTVISYGVQFTFSKCNRGQSVVDSRSGKRVSLSFAKAELRRILGDSEGARQYAALVA